MKVLDPIVELKTTKLWKYLNSINQDLADQSVRFVEATSPILATIKKHFEYFTRHDAHHGYQVTERMAEVVDPNCLIIGTPISFTAEETYLLVCSAYAHDLGMTVFPAEKEKLLQQLDIIDDNDWEKNPVLLKHLRKFHSSRGGSYIRENYQSIGLPISMIGHLDRLMKAHNLSISQLESELGNRAAGGRTEIDLMQLACILCIGDILEFSDTRVVDGVLNNIEEKLRVSPTSELLLSYRHNLQHICIGNNLAIGADGKIIFSGEFADAEVLNLAHTTID